MFMGSGNPTLTHGIICISLSHFLSLEYVSVSHYGRSFEDSMTPKTNDPI